MAKLDQKEVLKTETLSISAFAKKFADGVSNQAIAYAIKTGKVDYIVLGKDRFIVMTEKTKQYAPNTHPVRSTMRT